MLEIIAAPGDPLALREKSFRDYKGARLPGSIFFQCKKEGFNLAIQHTRDELWRIEYRHYYFSSQATFITKENLDWLRMEIVLAGSLHVLEYGKKSIVLQAGYYHVANSSHYQSEFLPGSQCRMIVIYFSPELIHDISPCSSRSLRFTMNECIHGILHTNCKVNLQNFFLDSSVRTILFHHLSIEEKQLREELAPKIHAAVIAADHIIAANLSTHHSTRSLSRQVGINEYILKKGFRIIFGIGTFERLMKRRMEKACELMDTTDLPLKEIAVEAGYTTYHGFTTGFKRRFGVTPSEWMRREGRGESGDVCRE